MGPAQRTLLVAGGAAAAGALGALAIRSSLHLDSAHVPRMTRIEPHDSDQVTRGEWAEVRAELQRLREELDLLRSTPRLDAAMGPARAPADASPAAPVARDSHDALTPEEALARYVASFQEGGDGIEYYRLIVQAHVPDLVSALLAHIATQRQTPRLRLRLVELVGDGRLRGRSQVLATLGAVLVEPDDPALSIAVAVALTRLCGPRESGWLEQRWASPTHVKARVSLLDHLVALAGEDPNPMLARVLAQAPDDAARSLVVERLAPSHAASAEGAFETVRTLAQPVRLAGAVRVHEFRSPGIVTLVEVWRATETDEAVRQALGAAADALSKLPAYHPEQACGAPDVADIRADLPQAWAPATADGGAEWLEVDFAIPAPARAVRVHETCRSGAIREVVLVFDDGSRETAWRGAGSRSTPGVFEVSATPSRAVCSVRVVLDTSGAGGWNEIDAVELVSPSGSQWASGARASSYYGQGHGKRQLGHKAVFLDPFTR